MLMSLCACTGTPTIRMSSEPQSPGCCTSLNTTSMVGAAPRPTSVAFPMNGLINTAAADGLHPAFAGAELRLLVVGYIRPEANFTTLEALISRIHMDAVVTKEALTEHERLAVLCRDPALMPNREQAGLQRTAN